MNTVIIQLLDTFRSKLGILTDTRLKRYLLLAIVAASIVTGLTLSAPGLIEFYYKHKYKRFINTILVAESFKKTDSVLIVAPHPDDEVLVCAGSILAAKRAGAKVHVLWLTSGDGFEWDKTLLTGDPLPSYKGMIALGWRRMDEARTAVYALGLNGSDYTFLGYPDGGLAYLLFEHYNTKYKSRYTGASTVPYLNVLSPQAEYTGRNLEHDVKSVIDSFNPTIVYAPSSSDRHLDHRAASYLTLRVMIGRNTPTTVRFYMVHGGLEWPAERSAHFTTA